MITTDAWVIHAGPDRPSGERGCAELRAERVSFPDLAADEVLVEPLFGCWEGNMTHALRRDPVDVCRQRGEEQVVLGNAGVVRVLRTGAAVESVTEGDECLVFCNGVWDAFGFPQKIFAYDAPCTIGVLAKRTKLRERQLIRIPEGTRFSLQEWAAFSLRYVTAWANWKLAYGCWQQNWDNGERPQATVWGWGGGVAFGEVTLARRLGCKAALVASDDNRLAMITAAGVTPVDRRAFSDLDFDPGRYRDDPSYRDGYLAAEAGFLATVREHTGGMGVSIFIDFIGLPVARATLKALGRPGVLTTAGWKAGMQLSTLRATECMNWHTHVHTHYARYVEGLEAVRYADAHGWMPVVDGHVYGWDDVPALARDYSAGRCSTYFPVFEVNAR